jgi:hypothetical protein
MSKTLILGSAKEQVGNKQRTESREQRAKKINLVLISDVCVIAIHFLPINHKIRVIRKLTIKLVAIGK